MFNQILQTAYQFLQKKGLLGFSLGVHENYNDILTRLIHPIHDHNVTSVYLGPL